MPRPSKTRALATASSNSIGGSIDWNVGSLQQMEMFPALTGHALLRELNKMVHGDETAGSMMWCIRTVLTGLPWKHKAQVNGKDNDTDPTAIQMSDFADTLLDDMEISWREHVEEAITMVWAGFAPCEIITKQRDGIDSLQSDEYYGVKHIPLRDQFSIYGLNYLNGDRSKPISMRQLSNTAGNANIPLWKLANYRMDAHLDSPWGTPLFQTALRPWQFKRRAQESEAVGIERDLCGIPVFRIPLEDMEKASEKGSDGQPTPEAKIAIQRIANAQIAVRDMRFNRTAGLILPSNSYFDEVEGDRTPMYDFKLVTSGGQRSIDVRTAIRDYDRAIARVLMMQFLHLGDRSSGSYALSDDQSTMAIRALLAIAQKIADTWRKAVLTLIWQINGFDKKYMPRLDPGEVSKEGLTAIGTFLRGVGSVEDLWATDTRARASILGVAGISNDREAQSENADSKVAVADLAANPPPTQTVAPPTPTPANANGKK